MGMPWAISSNAADTGYRYYHDEDLERLQQILFFRELNFSLKEIQKIMSASDYNKEVAMQKQRELLSMEKKRLSLKIIMNAPMKSYLD